MLQKILVILGTRPEGLKLVPVIRALREDPKAFDTKVVLVAQHREILDEILKTFKISVDFDLNLMRPNQSLTHITTSSLQKLSQIYKKERPDWVLVQGDTTTAMAATLAAHYQQIPVAHIEAGLRTENKLSPFPEEMNRRLISVLADLHFAPTTLARNNLLREGIHAQQIIVTGNTLIDTLHLSLKELKKEKNKREIAKVFAKIGIDNKKKIVLITAHRRESFGKDIRNICQAIAKLATLYPKIQFVYPVHPNPNILIPVKSILAPLKNVLLPKPLSYLPFIALMQRSLLILTDSGGIQEEAPSLGKRVLIMRDHTERQEGIEAGYAILIGRSSDKIIESFEAQLSKKLKPVGSSNPYGDGKASQRIVKTLKKVGATSQKNTTEIKRKVPGV